MKLLFLTSIFFICKMGTIITLLDITIGISNFYFNLLTALYLPHSSPRQSMVFSKFTVLQPIPPSNFRILQSPLKFPHACL